MPDEFEQDGTIGEAADPASEVTGEEHLDPTAEPTPEPDPEPVPEPDPEPEPVETPEQAQERIVGEIYPYPRDAQFHPLSFLFFRMPFLVADMDTCHNLATWLFDKLGCAGPGSTAAPVVKYDARGTSGAPWEDGVWIPADTERVQVQVTTPETDLTKMSEEQLAEVVVNAQTALLAKRAGTAKEV